MCRDCGCGLPESDTRTIEVLRGILHDNDHLASHLREGFGRHGVLAVNVVGGPGAGKTELLRQTLALLRADARCAAVTGDLETENDARRLAESAVRVEQILTGTTCHLEAAMVSKAIDGWDLDDFDYLFIENVGNLVCPADFDLGENVRVALVSVTEGEDKPLKYPTLLHTADAVLITKTDLVEAVGCDLGLLVANVHEVRPGAEVLPLSARSGDGLDAWLSLLRRRRDEKAGPPVESLRTAR